MRRRETTLRPRYVLIQELVLVLASLAIGLGVCEIAVRVLVPIRGVGPTITTYDPYYGKALKESFSGQRITPEFTIRITTNSLGFRGPELGPLSRRPVLFLGDSFTLGYGVNDGREFPALVDQSLRERGPGAKIPVVNAGLGNNGNGRAVKFLRTEGPRYNPALVVLQVHDNDFDDNISEALFELTPAGELRELPYPCHLKRGEFGNSWKVYRLSEAPSRIHTSRTTGKVNGLVNGFRPPLNNPLTESAHRPRADFTEGEINDSLTGRGVNNLRKRRMASPGSIDSHPWFASCCARENFSLPPRAGGSHSNQK